MRNKNSAEKIEAKKKDARSKWEWMIRDGETTITNVGREKEREKKK